MTTENIDLQDEAPSPESPVLYHLDLPWFDEVDRSLHLLTQRLLCAAHKREGDPVGSPGSGSSLIATIQQCCSTAPEYNNPSLPIMEVIFRVFLASGNKPMTLEEIHEQFRIWVGPSDGRALNEDVLKKLVGADLSYGIHPYVGETEAA